MVFSLLFLGWVLFATVANSLPRNDIISSLTDTTTDTDFVADDDSTPIFPDNTDVVLGSNGLLEILK